MDEYKNGIKLKTRGQYTNIRTLSFEHIENNIRRKQQKVRRKKIYFMCLIIFIICIFYIIYHHYSHLNENNNEEYYAQQYQHNISKLNIENDLPIDFTTSQKNKTKTSQRNESIITLREQIESTINHQEQNEKIISKKLKNISINDTKKKPIQNFKNMTSTTTTAKTTTASKTITTTTESTADPWFNIKNMVADVDKDYNNNSQCGRTIVKKPVDFDDIYKIHDVNTYFGEFPWMLVLSYRKYGDKELKFKCGASIVAPNIALTAAHCLNKAGVQYSVRARDWSLPDDNNQDWIYSDEYLSYIDLDISHIILHPEYNPNTLDNNIALLVLSDSFNFGGHINSICLPNSELNYDDQNCFIIGWGKDDTEDDYSTTLKKVDLSIIENNKCQTKLRETKLGPYYTMKHSDFCASNKLPDKNTCKGDGGGPLICPIKDDPNRYIQVGVSGWSVGCSQDIPGLYTDVEYYLDWIEDTISSQNGLCMFCLN